MRTHLATFSLAFTLTACSSPPPPEAMPGCNPVVGDDCVSPFPSSFYETTDSSTATGVRVSIPDGVLPVSNLGSPTSTARINQKDGFSPSTELIVYFKAGVDASMLPTASVDDLTRSVTAQSPVQILDYATGERVPVMAELDANATPADGDRQALLIHPMNRLKPGTRYVVALVNLNDSSGKPLVPAPFKALRDKMTLSKSLQSVQSLYEDLFAMLQKNGVARSSLTLAWDLTTASDESATSHLVGMRDLARSMTSAGMTGYTITSSTDLTDMYLAREIVGTLQVPSFLVSDANDATMNFGPDGQPAVRGMGTANFVVHIPNCAKTATAPLPVLVFGHGLFGDAKNELSTDYEKEVGNRLCMIQIGTNWIGLSSSDVSVVGNAVSSDINKVVLVTDRLQQAHVNVQVLTQLFLQKMKDDPALMMNGKPVADGSQIYYYGISDGGIQGGTYMALSPDVVRGTLNVPGCEWSLMAFRSYDFASLKSLLNSALPDYVDQQVWFATLQSEFDYSDPATFASHILQNPLPGVPAKHILVQEAIGDAQVTNLSTRILVRELGIPGMDLEQPVYGVDEKAAPLDSAYTQWDIHPMPLPPAADVTPIMDNGAHENIRALDALQNQLKSFFTPTGQVTQTCSGPCVFAQ